MAEEFKRKNKYIVFKTSDLIRAGLSLEDQAALSRIQEKVCGLRASMTKPALECVVVESDWPEYEPVWQMIEERVTGKTKTQKEEIKEFLENMLKGDFPSILTIEDRVITLDTTTTELAFYFDAQGKLLDLS